VCVCVCVYNDCNVALIQSEGIAGQHRSKQPLVFLSAAVGKVLRVRDVFSLRGQDISREV
jgi:hypothetical protein